MTALKPRNRVVVFRLTHDEYNSLKDACNRKGGRNLSEFTRAELLERVENSSLGHTLDRRLSELDRKMVELRASLEGVRQVLEAAPPVDAVRA
jgi:hypothetical protein